MAYMRDLRSFTLSLALSQIKARLSRTFLCRLVVRFASSELASLPRATWLNTQWGTYVCRDHNDRNFWFVFSEGNVGSSCDLVVETWLIDSCFSCSADAVCRRYNVPPIKCKWSLFFRYLRLLYCHGGFSFSLDLFLFLRHKQPRPT